jgi:hypothetical protein
VAASQCRGKEYRKKYQGHLIHVEQTEGYQGEAEKLAASIPSVQHRITWEVVKS